MDENIFRYSAPTKMDTAAHGTKCFVVVGDIKQVYTQCSHDEEDPRWELTEEIKI
jgi:hypothetical protein